MRWRGLSYRQLAYLTGLSAGHLNHLTRGRRAPTEETLETVARALHVEPEYFAEYRRSLVIDELETRPDVVDLVYGYLTSDATDESEVLGRPTRPATDLV
ncbi:MAG TPA: helix-turn-helix transcriptional regulator [Thermoleophilia bacterium]|nr:helix-turn-helix transcriptional regulator [Thermoleophilia bacterium]